MQKKILIFTSKFKSSPINPALIRNSARVWVVLFLALLTIQCAHRPTIPPARGDLSLYQAVGAKAVAVSDKPFVAGIGIEILKKGGNAFDAFAAMSFAVSVTAPHSTGLGGGGFALFQRKGAPVQALDFRERAAMRATRDMFTPGTRDSLDGARSIAVPGMVAGVLELHQAYGKLSRDVVMEPAIRLARRGFEVDAQLAEAFKKKQKLLESFSESKQIFFKDGRVLKEGDLLIQEDLAKTLELIVIEGKAGFYSGRVARSITDTVKFYGGSLRAEDFDRYRTRSRPPIQGTYRGYTVYSMPPPSSGGILLVEMLNLLELKSSHALPPTSADRTALLVEVMRRGYFDRARLLGDSDFVSVPVKKMISKKYAQELASTISNPVISQPVGDEWKQKHLPESNQTSHLSVVDSQGNVVASTQSVNYYFGSGVVAKGTGVVLNDTMDDFSIHPGVPNAYGLVGGRANEIQPQKTPLSSMTPTLVFKGPNLVLTAGAPGGSRIITAVLQGILNHLDLGKSVYESVAMKRIHHQYLPDRIEFDPGMLSAATKAELEKRGYQLDEKSPDAFLSMIGRDVHGNWVGAVDPRSWGEAVGW